MTRSTNCGKPTYWDIFFKEKRNELLIICNNGPQRYNNRCGSTHFLDQAKLNDDRNLIRGYLGGCGE